MLTSPQLMVTGDLTRAEAADVQAWIAQSVPQENWRHFSKLSDGIRILETSAWIPDLIVFIQSWPDEYSRQEIDQIGRLVPLARWLVGYGPWCESDGRTRDIWPLAVRVPLHSAATRLQREWHGLSEPGEIPILMSASREEAFAADHPSIEPPGAPASVVVCSPDGEYQRYLLELLKLNGLSASAREEFESSIAPVAGSNQESLAVILFDLDPWGVERRTALLDVVATHTSARIVGLMNLPSPEVAGQRKDLGVAAVVPKLGDQQRILEQLQKNLTSGDRKPDS